MLRLLRAVGWVTACAVAGAALGAVARWWMRLLSDDPEFSWNGTIAIVVVFTVAGAGHALADRTRQTRRRWATLGRVVGGILTLGLFVAAGGMMLPTVAGGSLAVWRRDWPRWTRALPAAVALPVPVSIAGKAVDDGLSPGRVLGLVLFAATYAVIIRAMGPVVAPLQDGWRLARWARIAAAIVGLAAVAAATLLAVGFAFNPDAS
ncbi:MAG: hypothetical protein OEW29_16895 [Acidimicrobiia bacterium]|nr:hypothetical protein [Acidimicrobiia bacterium]